MHVRSREVKKSQRRSLSKINKALEAILKLFPAKESSTFEKIKPNILIFQNLIRKRVNLSSPRKFSLKYTEFIKKVNDNRHLFVY